MSDGPAAAPARADARPRADYVIRGGQEGKRRLELIGRTLWPTTLQLLKRAGVGEGMACLDMGCGGGDVTLGIARLVGPAGSVVGVDIDAVKLEAARREAERLNLRHVAFRQGSLYEWSEEQAYDRIYVRFLLTHLPDRTGAVGALRRALRPGGTLIVEDIDFTGSFAYPHCPAYERYVDLYRRVVLRRGGDPDIGPKLRGLLADAGLQSVHASLVHPFHYDQEEKTIHLSTFLNIIDAIVAENLASREELEQTAAELAAFTDDPTTLLSLPRIFQVWGRRA